MEKSSLSVQMLWLLPSVTDFKIQMQVTVAKYNFLVVSSLMYSLKITQATG